MVNSKALATYLFNRPTHPRPAALGQPARARQAPPTAAAASAEVVRGRWQTDADLRQADLLQQDAETLWLGRDLVAPHGLICALHGFSASPNQMQELGERCVQKNFVFLAPRAPGHGHKLAGATPTATHAFACPDPVELAQAGAQAGLPVAPLPGDGETAIYSAHAAQVLHEAADYARAHGLDFAVVGYSLGGAMALSSLASTSAARAARAVALVAPLIRPQRWQDRLLYALLGALPGGPIRQLAMRQVFAWPDRPARRRPDYAAVPVGALFCATDYAAKVQRQLEARGVQPGAAIKFFVSEHDTACGADAAEALRRRCLPEAKIWRFDAVERVGHNMMGRLWNDDVATRTHLNEEIVAFLIGRIAGT